MAQHIYKISELLDERRLTALYLLSVTLFSLSRAFDALAIAAVYPVAVGLLSDSLQLFAAALLFAPFLSAFFDFKGIEKIFTCAFLLIFGITGLKSHSFYLVWFAIYLIACPFNDFKLLAKVMLCVSAFAIILGVLGTLFGIDSSFSFVRGSEEIRLSLGFVHPNSFGLFVLILIFSYLILRYDKLGLFDLIPVLLSCLVVQSVSGSRTTSLGLLVCYFVLCAVQLLNKYQISIRIASRFFGALFPLFALLSVTLIVFYSPENGLMLQINGLLSGRLSYPHGLIEKNGINLFGFNLAEAVKYVPLWAGSDGTIPIDNIYAKILIAWGPIVFCILCMLWLVTIRALSDNGGKNSYLLLGVLGIASIIGLAENYAIDVIFLYPCLVLLKHLGKNPHSDNLKMT